MTELGFHVPLSDVSTWPCCAVPVSAGTTVLDGAAGGSVPSIAETSSNHTVPGPVSRSSTRMNVAVDGAVVCSDTCVQSCVPATWAESTVTPANVLVVFQNVTERLAYWPTPLVFSQT